MLKKILFLIGFIAITTAQAQKTISGEFTPADKYSWIMLYKIKGTQQVFVANGAIKEGKFKLSIPETTDKGMMRLVYSMDEGHHIDFIYNQEDISFTCNLDDLENTISFENSEENKLYFNYLKKSNTLKREIDSLQVSYLTDEKSRRTAKKYKWKVKKLENLQEDYEEDTENMIANHLIKALRKFYTKEIIEDPQICLNTIKEHFFDYIDFSDEYLKNSVLLPEKIIDYVFKINASDDVEVQNKIYKKACLDVLEKAGNDMFIRRSVLEFLLRNFSIAKNVPTVDFLIEEYKKLQQDIQSPTFLRDIQYEMRLAIGRTAPYFEWGKGKKKNLYELPQRKNYVLVFWSTTCPHCLNEIPDLYDFTKNNKDVMVIAIALEDDDLGFQHYSEKFNKWTHILNLEKWKSDIPKLYDIHTTPTYYILDSSKRIVANPELVKDVKDFLSKKTDKKTDKKI
ncbi:MAG: AhpC/TSA family protein [Flavobacteriaceae bacterium]|nr:AhpC/TSA family protein [Flavobacteriaceae bacterium]